MVLKIWENILVGKYNYFNLSDWTWTQSQCRYTDTLLYHWDLKRKTYLKEKYAWVYSCDFGWGWLIKQILNSFHS